jgi:hypothetical protein
VYRYARIKYAKGGTGCTGGFPTLFHIVAIANREIDPVRSTFSKSVLHVITKMLQGVDFGCQPLDTQKDQSGYRHVGTAIP